MRPVKTMVKFASKQKTDTVCAGVFKRALLAVTKHRTVRCGYGA